MKVEEVPFSYFVTRDKRKTYAVFLGFRGEATLGKDDEFDELTGVSLALLRAINLYVKSMYGHGNDYRLPRDGMIHGWIRLYLSFKLYVAENRGRLGKSFKRSAAEYDFVVKKRAWIKRIIDLNPKPVLFGTQNTKKHNGKN